MPVRICCPMCKSTYAVPDEVRGKRIRCKDCAKPINIPAPKSAAPAPIPAAPAPLAPAAVEKAITPAKTKPVSIKPAAAATRAVIRKPQEETPPARSKKPLLLGLGCLGLAAVFMVCGGGAAAFFFLRTPDDQAVAKAKQTAESKDAKGDPANPPPATTKDTAKATDQTAKPGSDTRSDEVVKLPTDTPREPKQDSPKQDLPKQDSPKQDSPKQDPPKKDPVPPAGNGQLDTQVLAKVKKATVYMRVTMSNGQVGQGSGFFGVDPGLVLTNAHVLGMLNDDDPLPRKVEIVYHSGQPDSRVFVGKILGVDRSSDLALLRVEGADLPEPLIVKSSTGLVETQTVYVVGFPLGDRLGKDITVNTTSVSSLRKGPDGEMNKVQVNGGMNPGNSGGPVINASGEVVGVAVSGITGTQINFAVPGEYVGVVMNGRATGLATEGTVKDGDKVRMRVTVGVLDPLQKVQKVELEWWIAPPGPPRPHGPQSPPAKPGDSPHQVVAMAYQAGKAQYDLFLPPDLKPGQLVWMQPIVTKGTGQQQWSQSVSVVPSAPLAPLENIAADLRLKNVWGARPVTIVSKAALTFSKPGQKAETDFLNMNASLTETMTAEQPAGAALRMRYQKFSVSYPKTAFADMRDQLQKAVNSIKFLHANLLVDQNNNLKKNEVDPGALTKAPNEVKKVLGFLNGQVQDSLEMLWVPLPGRTCQPGESWKATRSLLVPALPDIPMQLTFTYKGVRVRDGRPEAVIAILGVARDKVGKFPVTGQVTGFAHFDIGSGQVSQAIVNGKLDLNLGAEGKIVAKLDSKMDRTLGKEILNVRDQLTKSEPVDNKGCPFKGHMVQMEAGKPYVISMESFNGPGYFDTFLRVEDMNGKVLAQDDDSGVDLNSLLVFTPPATGQYRIVATCFQPRTGNYMLIVRQADERSDAPAAK